MFYKQPCPRTARYLAPNSFFSFYNSRGPELPLQLFRLPADIINFFKQPRHRTPRYEAAGPFFSFYSSRAPVRPVRDPELLSKLLSISIFRLSGYKQLL